MEEHSTKIVESTDISTENIDGISQEKPPGKDSDENSEYDSAGSYSDEEEGGKIRSRGSDHGSADCETEEDGDSLLERQEGDGQESVPLKKVDDDEDKKNPQYIPKRGTFYEHDDRTADDIESNEQEAKDGDKDGKKKVWQDKKEKWTHDRFNDNEQAPKSRSELVSIYGYDIRNEDGPPRARRRRRYGRGPNKYTRNWEDEDAYGKPAPNPRIKKQVIRSKRTSRNDEEFPPLGNNSGSPERQQAEYFEVEEKEQPREQQVYHSQRHSNNRTEPVQESNGNAASKSYEAINTNVVVSSNYPAETSLNQSNTPQPPRIGSGRVVKPKKEIKDSDYRGFTSKTRQVRNVKHEQQKVQQPPPRTQKKEDFIQSQNFTNKNSNLHEIEKDMGKLSMQEGGYKGKHNSQRQGSMPPRLQNEHKGSKRYSSMRQRSVPESATPPNYPTTFYPNEYNQQAPQGSQQGMLHPNPVPQLPPQTTLPPLTQVPVTAAPLLQPQFAQPFPQAPPPFLQTGVAPPPFIPPQTPQIINYVPSQPPFNPSFQGYQQQFNPVTQPTELYQQQGGITYYSTDQQVIQRSVPQKRPKAAIPIVAPPANETKGRMKKEEEATTLPEKNSNNPEQVLEVQQ